MTMTKSSKMKTLAVGAVMTLMLGAGASAAVARQGSDDAAGHLRSAVVVGHVRHSGTDDAVGHAKHGADDGVGHL